MLLEGDIVTDGAQERAGGMVTNTSRELWIESTGVPDVVASFNFLLKSYSSGY